MDVDNIIGVLPRLETERLILRRLTADDAEDIFAYASDPEVTRYLIWEPHQSLADSRAFIAAAVGRYEAGIVAPWGIELKREKKIIGTCDYISLSVGHERAEIGYALSRTYWGQGLMSEAVRKIIAFGFEVKGFNRIQAVCETTNIASARVMEKVGMSFEGILRQYLIQRKTPRDVKMYAILRQDWMKRESAEGDE